MRIKYAHSKLALKKSLLGDEFFAKSIEVCWNIHGIIFMSLTQIL